MTIPNIQHIILTIPLLCGAAVGASASDSLFIETSGVEPGETRTLYLQLENSQDYYGFQVNIQLPSGMEFVTLSGNPQVALTDRTDESFRLMTNLVSSDFLKVGTFSTNHSPISGESGELLAMTVKADEGFTGGELKISNIYFTDARDNDVELPDFVLQLGLDATNTFYIEDFTTEVNGTTRLQIILDNETPFRAFQTDIYMPEGLEIVDNSFAMTSRGASGHTLTSKTFDDGRTRLACISLSDQVFSGHSGALVEFTVRAVKGVADECDIELKNQIFSRTDALEYVLPNSMAHVIVKRSGVTGLELPLSAEMKETETMTLAPVVTPEEATGTALKWESSVPSVATVNQNGEVTAISIGKTIIKVSSPTNSSVYAECELTVIAMTVSEITLDTYSITLEVGGERTLKAIVSPATAHDKTVSWSSNNPSVADVDWSGKVTAYGLGDAEIIVEANDGSGVQTQCKVKVVPTPVQSIEIQEPVTREFKVGETISLTAVVLPENATDRTVTWSSKQEETASVNPEGVVTALNEGEVTIVAKSSSGPQAEITLTVVPTLAESLTIQPDEISLFIGQDSTLEVVFTPTTTTNKNVSWSSSADTIVEVDDEGNITAISEGEAVITATALDGSDRFAQCHVTVSAVPEPVNILFMQDVTMKAGVEQTVNIELENETEFTAFQLDIYMPEGVDIVDNSLALTSRGTTSHTLSSQYFETDRRTRVIVVSPLSKLLKNSEGGLLQFNLSASAPLESAIIRIENVKFTEADGTERPLANSKTNVTVERVPVERIDLNMTEIRLRLDGSYKLEATVYPEYATDKSLDWSVDFDNIATVDQDGNVRAVSLGDAIVTVKAKDGTAVSSQCKVKVGIIPVEDITITAPDDNFSVKKGKTLQLSATVSPDNATEKDVVWSSSDPATAEVSQNGLVTAYKTGEVQITVKASDEGGFEKSMTVVITPPIKGDVNGTDDVTVSDVVVIFNYILERHEGNFDEEAADIDGDNKITVSDATAVVTIVLNQDTNSTSTLMTRSTSSRDCLSVADMDMRLKGMTNIDIFLSDNISYSALQADIELSEGMALKSVALGEKAFGHLMMSNMIADNVMRVVLFDVSNKNFGTGPMPLLTLQVEPQEGFGGELVISNVIAADAKGDEYRLYGEGAYIELDTTGIGGVNDDMVSVEVVGNKVIVGNALNMEVLVCSLDGRIIKHTVARSEMETISPAPGVYIVKVGESVHKILVK